MRMRKRASGCIYDDEMEMLGYRRVGDMIDVAYGKYLDNGAWVSIVEDDIVGGLWYAAVAEDGWNYREVGESFDSPIAAHKYVSDAYGFKTGARMRKRADDVYVRMYSDLVDYIEKIRDDAEQLIHANSHMLSEYEYGHLCGIRDAAIEILEKTGLY